MELSFDTAIQFLQKSASGQKKAYNTGLKARCFDEGDLVWRCYPQVANQKFGLDQFGLYRVIPKVTDVTHKVEYS